MPLSKYQRYLVYIIPLVTVGLICYFFFDIVTYIVLAWIISMIGGPLHKRLSKFLGSAGAALATLVTFFMLMMALIWLFIPPIIQQARNLATIDYESAINSFEEPLNDWNNWLVEKGLLDERTLFISDSVIVEDEVKPFIEVVNIDTLIPRSDSTKEHITLVFQVHNSHPGSDEIDNNEILDTDSFVDRVKKNLVNFINPSRISQILGSIFGALGNTLITIMSVFFIAFFFLKEQGLFTSIVRSVTPNEQEDQWAHAIDESANLLKRYFIGIASQIIVISIFVTGTLQLLGFKNALLIGFFAALMNVIPYLGPLLGAMFGIVITISSNLQTQAFEVSQQVGDGNFYDVLLPKLGLVVVVFGTMQMLDNFIVQPNIFSKSVKAHPLEIFIVILVGAKLGGILGMIVAIPSYTILRVLAKVFLGEFKVVQRMTKGM